MVSFTSLLLAVSVATGVFAAPSSELAKREPGTLQRRQKTPNAEGRHDGFFYSWWSDGGASLGEYTNLAGGEFRIRWGNGGNLVGGKGWNPGTNRVVSYSGSYSYNGNSYLAVYGWTRSPLVEYYVVENWGSYNPSSQATKFGTINVDGGTYDVAHSKRVNMPSIDGTQTFDQYWSVRREKRSAGSVNMDTHFKAWERNGLRLGNHYYQILACEGYHSTGQCQMKVWEGTSSGGGTTNPQPTPSPTPTPNPGNGGGSGNCAARWGQCGGQTWTGPTCCSEGTCRQSNQWYSQCQ